MFEFLTKCEVDARISGNERRWDVDFHNEKRLRRGLYTLNENVFVFGF